MVGVEVARAALFGDVRPNAQHKRSCAVRHAPREF